MPLTQLTPTHTHQHTHAHTHFVSDSASDLKVSVVRGRYDLWLEGRAMLVPQKSFPRRLGSGDSPRTSRLVVTAGTSSCTKSPHSAFT